MISNVNLAAPVGVLAFLGATFLLGSLLLTTLFLLIRRRFDLARVSSLAGLVIVGTYFAITVVFSLASRENVLARGQEKYFCEIDCHLAYSVIDSKEALTIGSPARVLNASGMFHLVTIKTRFDEHTISTHRGNGFLYPNPRLLVVIDERGRKYFPDAGAEQVLAQSKEGGTEITTPLRPGDSYTTTVVFDLPTAPHTYNLLISESDWITHLIIGHENSVFHKQAKFQL